MNSADHIQNFKHFLLYTNATEIAVRYPDHLKSQTASVGKQSRASNIHASNTELNNTH